ncbi:hypothetical protein ES703_81510 [subsurface metagenome]
MTRKEIQECRQRLREILKNTDEKKRLDNIKELAREVGASTAHTKIVGATTSQRGTMTVTEIYQNPISESELVQNINFALQAETMIDMCNTASRNFWIAVVAAIAAVVSALVACIAVLTTR